MYKYLNPLCTFYKILARVIKILVFNMADRLAIGQGMKCNVPVRVFYIFYHLMFAVLTSFVITYVFVATYIFVLLSSSFLVTFLSLFVGARGLLLLVY